MLRITFYILLTGLAFGLGSCYKDLGNYNYKVPAAPVVTHLDSLYKAIVGDTLTIVPTITIDQASPKLGYEWRIDVPELQTAEYYYGPRLQTVFAHQARQYTARLTIIDSSNGMKYFFPFLIDGQTIFSVGTVVLSLESGISQLSFILPDSTVKPRLYNALNHEDLPGGPQQLIPLVFRDLGNITTGFWIMCSDGSDPGVEIDPNNFQKLKSLRDNFFTPPAAIAPGHFVGSTTASLNGVINGKMYSGAWQTYNTNPIFGMFGLAVTGDYQLYPQAITDNSLLYWFGYDVNRKQVVGFTNLGSPSYIGSTYQVTDPTIFNPAAMGVDMLDFEQINSSNCYAFGKAADGTVYEFSFRAAFLGFIQITPIYKHTFPRPELITPTTKWTSSPAEIFYFSSGSHVYRYNPVNQEVKVLTTDFGGKDVSMVKILDGGNTLIAGVEGTLYSLDVSTGKFGDIKKKYDGIPGAPVDVIVR